MPSLKLHTENFKVFIENPATLKSIIINLLLCTLSFLLLVFVEMQLIVIYLATTTTIFVMFACFIC